MVGRRGSPSTYLLRPTSSHRAAAPPRFEARVFPGLPSLVEAGAREFAAAAGDALGDRGTFRVALSGGSTPRTLYARLTRAPYPSAIEWREARFFFGDERCVPPESRRSNFRMAREALFDPLRIPPENVFRMKGEEEPERAAADYEHALRQEFRSDGRPRFDFVLLGMGTDGHTASLFPGFPALSEGRRDVVANFVPSLEEWRLTLTYRSSMRPGGSFSSWREPTRAGRPRRSSNARERRGICRLPGSAPAADRCCGCWTRRRRGSCSFQLSALSSMPGHISRHFVRNNVEIVFTEPVDSAEMLGLTADS